MNGDTFLSIGEAAEFLGVSRSTVKRCVARGELAAYRTPGGHQRFAKRELALLRQARHARKHRRRRNRRVPVNPPESNGATY